MANNIQSNPLVLDTVNVQTGVLAVWNGRIKIRSIVFDNYILDTNNFVLTDNKATPRTIASANGRADLSPVRLEHIGWVDGLQLPTLTTGARVRVFIE